MIAKSIREGTEKTETRMYLDNGSKTRPQNTIILDKIIQPILYNYNFTSYNFFVYG